MDHPMHQANPPTPAEMAAVFERIREAVHQEATRPSPCDARQHEVNQAAFRAKLGELCAQAQLQADMTVDALWRHVWTKIRYAGFRATYVTEEVRRLTPFVADFRKLGGPDWHFDPQGIAHGRNVRDFLHRTGPFANVGYSRLEPKLGKMLSVAAAFREFSRSSRDVSALAFLFGDDYAEPSDNAFWRAHQRLAEQIGHTTALHVMMDIGFNCVKPDIWLVRLMVSAT